MKNILVLGGTRFFGRKLVELFIEKGHQVTIVTRGNLENPFGGRVKHVIADRTKKEELAKIAGNQFFDIVYDNICFSSNEAYEFCEVFNGKIGKLVFTSTLSVYEMDGQERREEDFDPYRYDIKMGNCQDFTYGEGKRQAEAVFFKYAKFPVAAVRIPIVMGADDYTRRLHFHVERVIKGEPIGFVNMDAEMSFIHATEAARFLEWAGRSDAEGPINAAANGRIALADLMKLVEEAAGKLAKITFDINDENSSPYAIPISWYMSTSKAAKNGFKFTNLHDWLKPLIEEIAVQIKAE